MTEVRPLSDAVGTNKKQYGLFATKAYAEGDVIFSESPLMVLSSGDVKFKSISSQFVDAAICTRNDILSSSSSILLAPSILEELNNDPCRISKMRSMLMVLASYAASPSPSDDTNERLLELYHPSIDTTNDNQDEEDAVDFAKLVLKCVKTIAAPNSALRKYDDNQLMEILLIYSCNSFEGGRIYHKLSRVNHSCNPNAVVVAAEKGDKDDSVLKAACDINIGDEISISYLGKYLFAGYPIRQRLLKSNKHFVCQCDRCYNDDTKMNSENASSTTNNSTNGDLASRIPCPSCHPRTGRYLDEDVMFDDDDDTDDHGLKVCYAVPKNGMTPEERSLHCPSCKGTTVFVADDDGDSGSMRKKKEGMAIKYMCMAEDKVFDHLQSSMTNNDNDKDSDTKKQAASSTGDDDNVDTEREMEQQLFQMATSICGAQHWTTHFLNLSLIEESLASFHATLMDPNQDAESMEEMLVDIAECADGIEKAYKYANSLQLKIDSAHWLFDYCVGMARILVGLGDAKSQKYGSTWIEKVEKYAQQFENEDMNKVVIALRDAWKRSEDEGGKKEESVGEEKDDCKRRKIG